MNKISAGLALFIIFFSLCGCVKKNLIEEKNNPYFIQASFDGSPWKLTQNMAYNSVGFQGHLRQNNISWMIDIITDGNNKDSICRGIWITFDYVPTVGKHYFSNAPLGYLPDSGMIGTYSYYDKATDGWFTRYAKDGYVEVTAISRDEFKGTFTFNATAGTSTDSLVVAITNGSFFLHNFGGGDNWPGP